MPPPDRWENYKSLGDVIPGTHIICCKVPLKEDLCIKMSEEEKFTPNKLTGLVADKGYSLKLVIDLTFTTKYYGPHEFMNQGVHHEKIFTEGHMVPSDEVVYRMFDILEKFTEENPGEDAVAAIHCTHGVNRTGYLVCRYMIERLEFDPEEAIQAYGEARGHPIERENYLADLKTRTLNTSYKYEGREKLPMVKKESNQAMRHNQTQRNCEITDDRSIHVKSRRKRDGHRRRSAEPKHENRTGDYNAYTNDDWRNNRDRFHWNQSGNEKLDFSKRVYSNNHHRNFHVRDRNGWCQDDRGFSGYRYPQAPPWQHDMGYDRRDWYHGNNAHQNGRWRNHSHRYNGANGSDFSQENYYKGYRNNSNRQSHINHEEGGHFYGHRSRGRGHYRHGDWNGYKDRSPTRGSFHRH